MQTWIIVSGTLQAESSTATGYRYVLTDPAVPNAMLRIDSQVALPVGEAFNKLVQFTGESPEKLTQLLYHSQNVGLTWFVFAAIGVASAVMIYVYGRWILKLTTREPAS